MKDSILFITVLLLLWTAPAATSAIGQQINAQTPVEEIVTIASRVPKVISELPLSLSQLDDSQLKLINHNHIQKTLLRIPGVNLQRGNGQESLPAIRSPILTGAGACGAFLMLQDGLPLRSSGFCNLNELFDAHTEQAQRIEVLRGPATAAYGSNAIHGLINVVTFDPNVQKHDNLISLEFGENDYLRLKSSNHFSSEQHQYGAKLTLTRDNGYRDMADYGQQKISLYHQTTFNDWNVLSGLSYSNLNQETAGFISGINSYKDRDIAKSNPTPEAFRDVQSFRAWTQFERVIGNNGNEKRLRITPYVRDTKMDFLQHFLPGDPLEENEHSSIGVQSTYQFPLSNNIELITGVDAEYTQGHLKQTQDLATSATTGSAFLQATIPTGTHYDYDVDATMLASFVNIDWSINEQWGLNLGLRLESQRYNYDNKALDGRTRDDGTECGFGGCRYSRPADRKDHFTDLSPKLGISYQLTKKHLIYANYMHGFRAPQATELYRLQRQQQVADLDSEAVKSIELGIKGRWKTLGYELVGYHMDKSNVIFRDSDFFNQDNGKTKHQGIEFALQYSITPTIDLSLNANYARHRYDRDQFINDVNINNNDIDTAPRHFGSMQLSWNITNTTQAELEWVHMGRYYLDPENLHDYEGHDLLNLRLNKQFNDDYRVYARLLNLINTRYAERADYTSFTQQRYFPGEPRSVFFGLEKNW